GEDLKKEDLPRLGNALAKFYENAKNIVIGRDMRISGADFFDAISAAFINAGINVIDIGIVDTPSVSFAVGYYNYCGGIQITASHNPAKYNGLKLCTYNARPINYDNGINKIEYNFKNNIMPRQSEIKGKIIKKDIKNDYINWLRSQITDIKKLKIVVDAGNGMAGKYIKDLLNVYNIDLIPLYFELDGSFPNHEANPLKYENLKDLQKKVKETNADIGAAFDGDADRVCFVDERGEIIQCDLITILIAKILLQKNPQQKILYDLRSSKVCFEEIQKFGGTPIISRVGHAYIKQQLAEENGIFAGELSGHYYFRDNYYCDNGLLAFLKVLEFLSNARQKLSEIIKPLRKYYASGEINSKVKNPDKIINLIEEKYKNQALKIFRLDGLSIEFSDYWFNLRKSNTEPELRLNLEARNFETMQKMRDQILDDIRQFDKNENK
ncbi:MAG TPA: phosphomannomutase/phosphoglucomutase, partial [bacterium]|nr:phosphomannomutase/phosphoglucomutase [bacterium]